MKKDHTKIHNWETLEKRNNQSNKFSKVKKIERKRKKRKKQGQEVASGYFGNLE